MARPKKVGAEGSMRELLLRVLAKTKAAVDITGVSKVEQAQDFVFNGNRVVAYNDRISISAPLPEDAGQFTVDANRLYQTLQKLPDEELEWGVDGDGQMVIVSKTTKATLKAEPLEGHLAELLESLALESLEEHGWKTLPEGFDEAINLCMFSASTDEANAAYNCLHFLTGQIVTTDNWRVSRYLFPQPKAKMDFLVRLTQAEELVGRGLNQIQVCQGWVHFRSKDGLVFSTRTMDVPFPECDLFFELSGKTITMPEGIVKALEAVEVFAPGQVNEKRKAELHFYKGKVVCVAEDGGGKIERTIAAPGMEPPPSIAKLTINPIFMMAILQSVATMKVAKGGRRVMFTAGNFAHVMNLPKEE